MKIHVLKEQALIDEVKRCKYSLPKQDSWECGDLILYYEEKQKRKDDEMFMRLAPVPPIPIAYEVTEAHPRARRSTIINNVSYATVELFGQLFQSYNEISDVETTLNKFAGMTQEKLAKYMEEVAKRIKMHGVIDDKQTQILLAIFKNEKTKKQLVEEGLCTFEEIDKAYKLFINDLEYLYDLKKDWVLDRANSFNGGEFQFKYSISKVAEMYEVDTSLLKKIAITIIEGCANLTGEEKSIILSAIESDVYHTAAMSEDDKKALYAIANKIIGFFNDCERKYYTIHAESLIKLGITHRSQISKYCSQNGLLERKVVSCMKCLGVTPNHHIVRGARLISDCWFVKE